MTADRPSRLCDDRPIPEWLHPAVERDGGWEIPGAALMIHFAKRPTKEMKAAAAKKEKS